jgi:glycosyltransferase involved in cell wall biosynthesis
MARIGILVVAYNAETTLRSVLTRIPDELVAKVEEIFVFDDESRDNTFAVAQQCQEELFGSKLSVFRNPKNLMYGGNQQAGYQYAIDRGLDIVVLLHGDGQYAPEVMQDLLSPLEAGRADVVMGSRMMVRGAARTGGMPLYKHVGNRVLTRIQNSLAGTAFSEFHSGYRAYSVASLRNVPLHELTTNWHFDTQILFECVKRGYHVMEVPIPTFYGDEVCYVNGIPYAVNCVREALTYAVRYRWRAPRAIPARSQVS